MRLSSQKRHLMQKAVQEALRPGEIIACMLAGVATFAVVYASRCFSMRYTSPGLASLAFLAPLAFTVLVTFTAVTRYRARSRARGWICASILMWCCFLPAWSIGDRYWWKYMVNFHTWKDMASYVNIDPDMDRGQSYMDAGFVYFKEGSFVSRNHTIAFRNGLTYCVAPILRRPVEYVSGAGELPTLNGFVLPRSGTVDFWAVGTDCCGNDGRTFDCGDVDSFRARSGLRILDSMSRSMYLLGVQEWSATTGLPVRHPLFFSWAKDPIMYSDSLADGCMSKFLTCVVCCVFFCAVASYMLHSLLQKVNVG
mmetsp:Transcript_18169/g.51891  ORF Transcript_18169/g.51891 Transcript_18169/m.51891 type:complete len:310 (+) Transcript_18169:94-1023(+)